MSLHGSLTYLKWPKKQSWLQASYHRYHCCGTDEVHRELEIDWGYSWTATIPLSRKCSCQKRT